MSSPCVHVSEFDEFAQASTSATGSNARVAGEPLQSVNVVVGFGGVSKPSDPQVRTADTELKVGSYPPSQASVQLCLSHSERPTNPISSHRSQSPLLPWRGW